MMHLKLLLVTYALMMYTVSADDVESAENAESYITKEAAKQLRKKLNAQEVQRDGDYDEILKEIIMSLQQPASHPKQVVYEKKYFDYLPNDLDSEDATGEDSTQELVKPAVATDYEYFSDESPRANSRRLKRDISSAQRRNQRQSIIVVPVPLVRHSPYPNVDFYFPHDLLSAQSNVNPYHRGYNYIPPNPNLSPNPWTPQNNPQQQFHRPYNFYLPALPGNNNPSPPDNPLDPIDLDDRISMFEDDNDRPVWATFPVSNNQGPYRNQGGSSVSSNQAGGFNGPTARPQYTQYPQFPQTTQRYPQTTRRPPQTTQRPPSFVDENALDFGDSDDQNVGVEIELPVQDYDEPLTTRAPLKKPNRRTTKRVTSTTPRPGTLSPSPDPNDRKPKGKVSPCVLAIVNCCSKYDTKAQTSCLERQNCVFFGKNPCTSEKIKAAAAREHEKYAQRG